MNETSSKAEATLYYAHDPMCSWCWAFRPVLQALRAELPVNINWVSLLGGLAPETTEPMPDQTKQFIQGQWQKIQQMVPNTEFNFDFWTACDPKRSTYPACRAVIAAREQAPEYEQAMIDAIQTAYYLQARNPSDETTLIELADEIGLDKLTFTRQLNDEMTYKTLNKELKLCRQLGLNQFPGLLFVSGDTTHQIPINYLDPRPIQQFINQC